MRFYDNYMMARAHLRIIMPSRLENIKYLINQYDDAQYMSW